MTGIEPQLILGKTLFDFFDTGMVDPRVASGLRDKLHARQRFEVEFALDSTVEEGRVLLMSGKAASGEDGSFIGYRGAGRDVTDAHQLSKRLSYQASHDDLTGLVNRREFEMRLERILDTTRTRPSEHALCYLDLDQFKIINDTCGHIARDALLRELGQLLPKFVRKRDTFARLGGDEFGVLMEHCSLAQAQRVASDILEAVEDFRFCWNDEEFAIGVSIGLVPIEGCDASASDLLKAADAACYGAKEGGRSRVRINRPDDSELGRRFGEMQWATRIAHAIECDALELEYQRIFPVEEKGGEGGGARAVAENEGRRREPDRPRGAARGRGTLSPCHQDRSLGGARGTGMVDRGSPAAIEGRALWH